MEQIFIQTIGFIALVCSLVSYQMKANKSLMLCQLTANVLFGIQFFLLGGVTGSINNGLSIIRYLMLLQSERWKWLSWKGWAVILSLLSLVVTIVTWNGILSIFPFISIAGANFCYWTKNSRIIRLGVITVNCPPWLIYAIALGSWGGVINELLSMLSTLISIYRYGWKALDKVD